MKHPVLLAAVIAAGMAVTRRHQQPRAASVVNDLIGFINAGPDPVDPEIEEAINGVLNDST